MIGFLARCKGALARARTSLLRHPVVESLLDTKAPMPEPAHLLGRLHHALRHAGQDAVAETDAHRVVEHDRAVEVLVGQLDGLFGGETPVLLVSGESRDAVGQGVELDHEVVLRAPLLLDGVNPAHVPGLTGDVDGAAVVRTERLDEHGRELVTHLVLADGSVVESH